MASSDESALDEGAIESLVGRVGALREGDHDGRGVRIGVACARFNGGITMRLLEGVLAGLDELGVDRADVRVAWVPGAFELPLVAQALTERCDAVICLGAVVRGETGHYDFVAGECASGIQRVQLDSGVPVIFGVLTTDDLAQALERSRQGRSNKGWEAAFAAVEMHRLLSSTI
jgi:6,7-dimethyl-8-ribityllumazine synthase